VDLADAVLDREAAAALRAQIAGLPAVQRAALDLVFTQRLSLAEVAAVM
jgi:DNA-directed RNA polymerase specialized sigma24 family protein